jgi:trypsin
MPKRMVMPRLPASVIMKGKYQLIPDNKIVGGSVVAPNSLPFLVPTPNHAVGPSSMRTSSLMLPIASAGNNCNSVTLYHLFRHFVTCKSLNNNYTYSKA